MLTSLRRMGLLGSVLIAAVSMLPADMISFDLNEPNAGLSAYAGPYAKVTVDRTATNKATITVASYTVGAHTFLIGAENAFAMNFSGPVSLGSVTFTGGCVPGGSVTCPAGGTSFTNGSGNVSDFGTFGVTLKNTDGPKNSVTSLSFVATLSTGTWGSVTAVLTPNESGHIAAAHILPSGTNTMTGFAGDGGTPAVPEPSAIGLFGTGLIAAAYFVRKRLHV